jgi:hypothetical protein
VQEIAKELQMPLGTLANRLDWEWVLAAADESSSPQKNMRRP